MILEMTRPVQGGLRQERKLEAVSNDLANTGTTGYKQDVVSFDREFKARLNTDHTQGDLKLTGNPLDVALGGEGFFKIETPDGIHYTRNGNFTLDAQGIITDQNGNPVLGQGGAIALEAGNLDQDLTILENGDILMGGAAVGTFDIVTFEDPVKLEKQGKNFFAYTGDPRDEFPPQRVVVKQRTLENSNVQVVDEMVRMIDYHRMFDTFTKSMQTFDEIDSKAINDVGMVR